jgi:LmbE family N-acetylglucosaminyl deacetylase
MRKIALFFCPHPDDLEIGISYYFMNLLEQKYRVIQISMTLGEFGTTNPQFKGKRIAKIRAKELDRATEVFEKAFQTKIEIIRLGYTDGYLPFTAKVRNEIIQLIKQYNPDIVFAPDPWYAQDFHPDHLKTGRLVTLALKKMTPELSFPIPLILYYSFRQNRYITIKRDYLKVLSNALLQYPSQISAFGVKLLTKLFVKLVFAKNFPRFRRMVKGYRNQDYDHKNELVLPPKFEENSLIDRIRYHFYHYPALKAGEMLHNISPEELGLEIKK